MKGKLNNRAMAKNEAFVAKETLFGYDLFSDLGPGSNQNDKLIEPGVYHLSGSKTKLSQSSRLRRCFENLYKGMS